MVSAKYLAYRDRDRRTNYGSAYSVLVQAARATYEEVARLQGIIIYNRTISIFLKREEVSQVYSLLPELMQQGQALIDREHDLFEGVQQQQREPAL